MGYVGKRTGMHEHRSVLESLDQVRLNGILEEDGHGAGALQITGGYGLAVSGVTNHDTLEPFTEVLEAGS